MEVSEPVARRLSRRWRWFCGVASGDVGVIAAGYCKGTRTSKTKESQHITSYRHMFVIGCVDWLCVCVCRFMCVCYLCVSLLHRDTSWMLPCDYIELIRITYISIHVCVLRSLDATHIEFILWWLSVQRYVYMYIYIYIMYTLYQNDFSFGGNGFDAFISRLIMF